MEIRQSIVMGLRSYYRAHRPLLICLLMASFLLVFISMSMFYGLSSFAEDESQQLSWTIWFTDRQSPQYLVLWELRLPRLLMGLLVGAALAIAGCLMQAIFKNPLATPGLVGVSSGASLFAATMIVADIGLRKYLPLFSSPLNIPIAAFLGSLLVCVLVYRISHIQGRTSVALLLMSGVAFNAIAEALTGFLVYLADDDQLRSITFWSLGSLSGAGWLGVACLAPLLVFAAIMVPFTYKALNALSAGDEMARHVGFDTEKIKKAALLFVALSVGVAVAFTGRIGFIGLMVPHLSRMLLGANHRELLISSFLLGPLLLISADFFSRHLAAPAEIPIGILTSAIGGPFFLYLLFKMRKGRHGL